MSYDNNQWFLADSLDVAFTSLAAAAPWAWRGPGCRQDLHCRPTGPNLFVETKETHIFLCFFVHAAKYNFNIRSQMTQKSKPWIC